MDRRTMLRSRVRRKTALVIGLAALVLPNLGLMKYYDGTGSGCELSPGRTCFHLFTSAQTPTTADHGIYQVNQCTQITYRMDGDGTAEVFIKECTEPSATGDCSVFVHDINYDGVIDGTDESITLDGTPGRRGIPTMQARGPWHWIDVQAVPASGTARVTITCH